MSFHHFNWQNEILAAALGKPFKISHHRDSCGDGGSGCMCEPDQGSFDGYTPAGTFQILQWITSLDCDRKEKLMCAIMQRFKERFPGDMIPLWIITMKQQEFVGVVLDFVR